MRKTNISSNKRQNFGKKFGNRLLQRAGRYPYRSRIMLGKETKYSFFPILKFGSLKKMLKILVDHFVLPSENTRKRKKGRTNRF